MTIMKSLTDDSQTAGILSLIKATMVLQKETIPPQVGISQKLGPYSCLKNGQMLVPENPISFSGPSNGQGRRRVLVNNFDAAVGYISSILSSFHH
jgi:acyl transferase domain-containing protein